MRRATITIGDELEPALDEYLSRQEVAPALTSLMQAALGEFLSRRGFGAERKRLKITPVEPGSGATDISMNHDVYLAEN